MKKQTISALLTALMICLTIAIVVVIVRIRMRGPKTEEPADSDSYIIQEISASQNNTVDEAEEPETVTVLVAIPTATSSVNVRSGPGTEYNRLGSAYSNNEYEVLEILSNGWTKLLYSEQVAYINSEYVEYKLRTTGEGTITYENAGDEVLAEYMTGGSGSEGTAEPQDGEPDEPGDEAEPEDGGTEE